MIRVIQGQSLITVRNEYRIKDRSRSAHGAIFAKTGASSGLLKRHSSFRPTCGCCRWIRLIRQTGRSPNPSSPILLLQRRWGLPLPQIHRRHGELDCYATTAPQPSRAYSRVYNTRTVLFFFGGMCIFLPRSKLKTFLFVFYFCSTWSIKSTRSFFFCGVEICVIPFSRHRLHLAVEM